MHLTKGLAVLLISCLALALIIILGRTIQNPFKVPVVKLVKLTETQHGAAEVSFTCPECIQCTLLLGSSNGIPASLIDGGKITIINKKGRADIILHADGISECNWLNRFNLNGLLLAPSNSSNWNWKSAFVLGGTNSLMVTNLQQECSVWLSYERPSGWNVPLFGKSREGKLLSP